MTLPRPAWTRERIEAWQAAVPLPLPLPPGEPSTWTCLLRELGPTAFFLHDDRGSTQLLDVEMVRALLRGLGRPVSDHEQLPLLLASPIPSDVEVDRALLGLLSNDSYWVRQRAAVFVGRRRVKGALPRLRQLRADSDNDARRGATEALGHLGDPAAIDDLCSRWDDTDSSVDVAAVEALVRLDAWDRAGRLLEIEEPGSEGWRLACALLSIERGEAEADVLSGVLEGGELELGRAVARYLCGRPLHAATLMSGLSELVRSMSDLDYAQVPATALGLAGPDGVEELIDLLGAPDWRVRAAAAMGLAHAPPLEAVRVALQSALTDDDGDVQREAGLALLVHGEGDVAVRQVLASLTGSHLFINRVVDLAAAGAELGLLGEALGLTAPSAEVLTALTGFGGQENLRGMVSMVFALASPELAGLPLAAIARGGLWTGGVEMRRAAAAGCLLAAHPPREGVVHRLLLAHAGSTSGGGLPASSTLVPHAGALAAAAATDPAWEVRLDALRLLQGLGEAADPYRSLLQAISRADDDRDCRMAAAGSEVPRWRQTGVAEALAQVVAPGRVASDEVRAFGLGQLATLDAPLAGRLARFLLDETNDRSIARAAARLVGAGATPENLGEVVALGVQRLRAEGWVAREAACDLLGALPGALLDEDLLDEVLETLQVRAAEDDDPDVQNAARAAISILEARPER